MTVKTKKPRTPMTLEARRANAGGALALLVIDLIKVGDAEKAIAVNNLMGYLREIFEEKENQK